jgi:hypothetical protein
MLDSFNFMTIQSFIELERIKRPSSIALSTGKLVCHFFTVFKDASKTAPVEIITQDWKSI